MASLTSLPPSLVMAHVAPLLADPRDVAALAGTTRALYAAWKGDASLAERMYADVEPVGLLRRDVGMTFRLAAPWRFKVTRGLEGGGRARMAVASKRFVVTADPVTDGGHVCWHHPARAPDGTKDGPAVDQDVPVSSSDANDDTAVVPGTLTWDTNGAHLYYVSTATTLPGAGGLSLSPAYLHVVARRKLRGRKPNATTEQRQPTASADTNPSRQDLPAWARTGGTVLNFGQRSVSRAVTRLVRHVTANVASATSGIVRPFGALVGALVNPLGGSWESRTVPDAVTTTTVGAAALAHEAACGVPLEAPEYLRAVTVLLPIGRVPFYLFPSACGTLLGYLASASTGTGLGLYVVDVTDLTMPHWLSARAATAATAMETKTEAGEPQQPSMPEQSARADAHAGGVAGAMSPVSMAIADEVDAEPGMCIVGRALAERRAPLMSGAPLYFSWSPTGHDVLAFRFGSEMATASAVSTPDGGATVRSLHTLGVAHTGAVTALQWVRGDPRACGTSSMGYALVCLTSSGGARVYLCRGEAVAHGRLDGAFDRAAVATPSADGGETTTVWERLCPLFDVASRDGRGTPVEPEGGGGRDAANVVRRVYALSASPDARFVAWADAGGVHTCRTPYGGGGAADAASIQEAASQPNSLYDFESDAGNRVRRGHLPSHRILTFELERVVAMQWSPTGNRLLVLAMHIGGPRNRNQDGAPEDAREADAPTEAFGFFRWHVVEFADVQSGDSAAMVPTTARVSRVLRFAPFYPSEEFARSVLPFFDQYQQSHQLWDPAGDRFCYCGYHFRNRRDASRVAATAHGSGAVFTHPNVNACFAYAQAVPAPRAALAPPDAPLALASWVPLPLAARHDRLVDCASDVPPTCVVEGEFAVWSPS